MDGPEIGKEEKADLSAGGDHAKLADIDLDDGSFCHNSELSVHRALRILLDAKDLELECRLEFGYGESGQQSCRLKE